MTGLKKKILGNLNNQSFSEIWLGEKAESSRKLLYTSKRNFNPCNVCDAEGTYVGGEHVKAWKKVYQNSK